jgi:hypothetical protein
MMTIIVMVMRRRRMKWWMTMMLIMMTIVMMFLDVPSLKSLPIITTYHSKAYIDIGASICQDS